MLAVRGSSSVSYGRRGCLPRVVPIDHRGEAGAGQGGGVRRLRPACAARTCGTVWSGLTWAALALAKLVDDAACFAHPVGGDGRGVSRDPAGERRGGLMEPARCPPGSGVLASGSLQAFREGVRGPRDRAREPRGQRAGEAVDAGVLPDLGPVVAGCLPDGRDQVTGRSADHAGPLPFGRPPIPAGARLSLGRGLLQRVRVGSAGQPVAAGLLTAGRKPEYVAQVSERSADVAEVVGGRVRFTVR